MNQSNFNGSTDGSMESDNEKSQLTAMSSELTFEQSAQIGNEASSLIADGKYEEALGLLDKIIHYHTYVHNLQYARALCLLNTGRLDEAKVAALSELQAFPDNQKARNMVARIIPQYEYIPEGWAAKDRFGGWESESMEETIRKGWQSFQPTLQSLCTGGPLNKDYSAHNTMMCYAYVLAMTALKKDYISILDYGGGACLNYLISKEIIPGVQIEYYCKETPIACKIGREIMPSVIFYEDEKCFDRKYDLVIASGSLQYLEDWQSVCERLASVSGSYLYITRFPMIQNIPSFVFVQRPYSLGHNTEFLGWAFNRKDFLSFINKLGLRVLREFMTMEGFQVVGVSEQVEYRGFLLSAGFK